MDGRIFVVGLTLVLPALLMVATVAWYSTNPVSMLVLCSVMLLGCLYLLTYREAFAPAPA